MEIAYIKGHVESLINILRMNELESSLLDEELADFNIENFSENFVDVFNKDIQGSHVLGYISISVLLSITFIIFF